MPTPNMQLVFQAVLSLTNNLVSPAPQISGFDFANPTLGATTVFFDPYFQALSSGSPVPFPTNNVFAIFVQNLSTTANLNVTITPFGGSPSVSTYGPAGVFICFDPAEVGTGFGVLTLQGVGGTVPAMVLVGA